MQTICGILLLVSTKHWDSIFKASTTYNISMRSIWITNPFTSDLVCWYVASIYLEMIDENFERCGLEEWNLEMRNVRSELLSRMKSISSDIMLSMGEFRFKWRTHNVLIWKSAEGDPLAVQGYSSDPPTWKHERLCISSDSEETIFELCNAAKQARHKNDESDKFELWRWIPRHNDWDRDALAEKRNIDTVILDDKSSKQLFDDVKEFTSDETCEWYKNHCIPYKRGYLLYGPPGTGKTSTVVALTSHLGRNIYRLSLASSGLDDASFLSAIQRVPSNSVVLFEDIDSLFGKNREKEEVFSVTFSGLLNAIDGVNDYSRGLIFFFTTNYLERLDPALRRPGRVDLVLHLNYCSDQQIRAMFVRFYPDEDVAATTFLQNIRQRTKFITPATLQHHFIQTRTSTAAASASKIHIPPEESDVNAHMYT